MVASPLTNRTTATQNQVGEGSRLMREAIIAWQMLRQTGLRATAAHARTIALVRLHHALIDRQLESRLPRPLRGTLPREAELRTVSDQEAIAAVAHSPVPALALQWALRGLGLDPRQNHFIDIGSGRGGAVLRAAMLPFRSVTGVEFVRAYHDDAVENLAWARANGLVKAKAVDLRHQSALEISLPGGPCMRHLYSPFEAVIMRSFLDLVDRSVRDNPRPLHAIYVNPVAELAFARPGVVEIPFAPLQKSLLRLFAPHAVKAYSWTA